MRSLKCVIAHASWLDRLEYAHPIVVGCNAAKAKPTGIERLRLQVVRMVVLAVCIGLPNLQHRIIHCNAVAIQYAEGDPYTFTFGLRACDALHTVLLGGQFDLEERANRLRRCWDKVHIRSQK